MQKLNSQQFYALSGTVRPTFKTAINRQEAALSFGIGHKLAGGIFLDLDVIAWRLTDELTPAFGRKLAAALIKGFSDVWCEAVSNADRLPEPIFLVVVEQGHKLQGGMRATYEGVNVGQATMAEFAKASVKAKMVPKRITLVNVNAVLATIRSKAADIGFNLSAPFIVMDDPLFIQAREEARKSREARVARIGARP